MSETINCFHCGDPCIITLIQHEEKCFCCQGCKTVYEILETNDMGFYYNLENNPGTNQKSQNYKNKYAYLDQDEIKKQFLLYEDELISKISFSIPQIHCSSCIWLLENLGRLTDGIEYSVINFPKRTAEITFQNELISLRQLVELLDSIGYKPDLKSSKKSSPSSQKNHVLFYKIGIAGFCFGNIMLLSFADYLGMDESFSGFQAFFGYLSLALALPVFFYSGSDYIVSAFKAIRQRFMNIDVPIAIGMTTLFARSTYEVISHIGPGYFDSLAGLIFFLLIGQWFQQKTFESLSFDRDYKSYFPIAVNKITSSGKIPSNLESLKVGDKIELRNNELIPSDSVLIKGAAYIDYSFVTGESVPVRKIEGDFLYAGGRQMGSIIHVELTKEVDNSYLTQLWNQDIFKKTQNSDLNGMVNRISKHFTFVILFIALLTGVFWYFTNPSIMWSAVTAVLIVACPCALALSVPFTLGNMTRIMGRFGLYLKNTNVIEKMSKIAVVVLDKTGTITHTESMSISFNGDGLTTENKEAIHACASNSAHPLSMAIAGNTPILMGGNVEDFIELPGQGISCTYEGKKIQMGSASFMAIENDVIVENSSRVFVSIDGKLAGNFSLSQSYRWGLKKVIENFKSKYLIHLVSGDNDRQKDFLKQEFGLENLYFSQSPMDKLNHIRNLQKDNRLVMMIGDGLNDAGALKQSDVGLAMSDNIHQFSPACDAILDSKKFELLPSFFKMAEKSMTIIYISFFISFLYNIIGLGFAISGNLSPLVAAILMPVSSISVVVFVSAATQWISKRILQKHD